MVNVLCGSRQQAASREQQLREDRGRGAIIWTAARLTSQCCDVLSLVDTRFRTLEIALQARNASYNLVTTFRTTNFGIAIEYHDTTFDLLFNVVGLREIPIYTEADEVFIDIVPDLNTECIIHKHRFHKAASKRCQFCLRASIVVVRLRFINVTQDTS